MLKYVQSTCVLMALSAFTLSAQVAPGSQTVQTTGMVGIADAVKIVNQKLGKRLLEKAGCRVGVASNGIEAVEMWDKVPYDVVFMACQMSEMDGFEATTEIRRRERGLGSAQRTPIVALTANTMQGDRGKCLAAGMDDFLPKPIEAQCAVPRARALDPEGSPGAIGSSGDIVYLSVSSLSFDNFVNSYRHPAAGDRGSVCITTRDTRRFEVRPLRRRGAVKNCT